MTERESRIHRWCHAVEPDTVAMFVYKMRDERAE